MTNTLNNIAENILNIQDEKKMSQVKERQGTVTKREGYSTSVNFEQYEKYLTKIFEAPFCP